MILKNVALLVTVLFLAIGVTACQDKTASQENREEMTEAVDDFTDTVDEITAEDGGRKEMVEAVEDFTDDIEDVTGDLGYDANEAGEQTK